MTPSIEKPTRVRYLVLAVLCSLAFITYFDRICIAQLKEDISSDLNLTELTPADEAQLDAEGKQHDAEAQKKAEDDRATSRMSWVFWAFILGYGLFEVPAGWMGDRWGARGVIFRIVVCWSIFTALTGSVDGIVRWFESSPAPWMLVAALVVARFAFGAGEAGAYPNISRALARWFPFGARASAQSAIWFCSRLGGAVSPLLITELARASGGWRQAFWIIGGIGIIWALAFYYWFRDRPEDMRSANQAEAELVRADSGPGSIHEDGGHQAVPWLALVTSPNLWFLYIAAATVSYSWYFFVTYLAECVKTVFGVPFEHSRWLTGAPLLAGAVPCILGGWLSDMLIRRTGSKRWGRSLPGLIGFGAAGLLTLYAPVLLAPPMRNYYLLVGIVCLACAFQDFVIPIIWTVSVDVGERHAGTVAGAMNCMGGIGASLGILLTPWIGHRYGWSTVFWVNGCVYLVGAASWVFINAEHRLQSRALGGSDNQAAGSDPPTARTEQAAT
jgi:MFS transporter, ACS family, glucarate transporter